MGTSMVFSATDRGTKGQARELGNKLHRSAVWPCGSQHPTPSLPLDLVSPVLVHPGGGPCHFSAPPLLAAFLDGGFLCVLVWALGRARPSGGRWDLAAGMWEIGPRAVFAKALELKASLGRPGRLFALGAALAPDAYLSLGQKAWLFQMSPMGNTSPQQTPPPVPVPAANRGGDCDAPVVAEVAGALRGELASRPQTRLPQPRGGAGPGPHQRP